MDYEHVPAGARGPSSGREFEPELAGGPIRRLSTARVTITNRGIETVEKHIARFGPDRPNELMIERLHEISRGRRQATHYELNFYTHELREFVRYRRLGWIRGNRMTPRPRTIYGTTPTRRLWKTII
jgi:hypothetical protein